MKSIKSVTRYAFYTLSVYAKLIFWPSTKRRSRSRPAANKSKSVVESSDEDDAMSVKSVARYNFIYLSWYLFTYLFCLTSDRPRPRPVAKYKPTKAAGTDDV